MAFILPSSNLRDAVAGSFGLRKQLSVLICAGLSICCGTWIVLPQGIGFIYSFEKDNARLLFFDKTQAKR
jgi:hypothetical protein